MSDIVLHVKANVLPRLFANPNRIGEFGPACSDAAMSGFTSLSDKSPVTALAVVIRQIVAKLADADPIKISKPTRWVDRLTGQAAENYVRYHVAVRDLDTLLLEAEQHADAVRALVDELDEMMGRYEIEQQELEAYIRAGQEFLAENPGAGVPSNADLEFDNPRERFERVLTNLTTLKASHGMTAMQLKLLKAQALSMLDRFIETSRTLVPLWRQHSASLTAAKHMDSAGIAAASQAHSALVSSLSDTVKQVSTTTH